MPATAPDLAALRHAGWSLRSVSGGYVVAWRGAEEVVFTWDGAAWHQYARRTVAARVA